LGRIARHVGLRSLELLCTVTRAWLAVAVGRASEADCVLPSPTVRAEARDRLVAVCAFTMYP
jgi:hypothetical protein